MCARTCTQMCVCTYSCAFQSKQINTPALNHQKHKTFTLAFHNKQWWVRQLFMTQTLSCFASISDMLFTASIMALADTSWATPAAPCCLTLRSKLLQTCFTQQDATRSATYSTVLRVDAGCPWKKLSSRSNCKT